MKEYDHLIIWLDYFNSTLSRAEGRRIPLNKAVRSPTLDELCQAASSLGYTPQPFQARYPKRSHIQSGYIAVEKKESKTKLIYELAEALRKIRGKAAT
ncbi:MAG: signal recognition particle subunit SRP19/SEC65 family protein [Nitrososphaerales archaeon]